MNIIKKLMEIHSSFIDEFLTSEEKLQNEMIKFNQNYDKLVILSEEIKSFNIKHPDHKCIDNRPRIRIIKDNDFRISIDNTDISTTFNKKSYESLKEVNNWLADRYEKNTLQFDLAKQIVKDNILDDKKPLLSLNDIGFER